MKPVPLYDANLESPLRHRLKHFYLKSYGQHLEMGYNQDEEDVPMRRITECRLKNNTRYRNNNWDLYSFGFVMENISQCGSLEIEMASY